MLLGDVVAIGIVYYLYTQWNNRPIFIRCEKCRKSISSSTPWVCGFCKEPNRNAKEFPFVRECEHCHGEPKAYRCHHCTEMMLVYLSEDKDTRNYAYCLNTKGEAADPDEQTERQKEKEQKQHQIEVAELELKLKAINEKRDGPKLKTPLEQKKEQFDRGYAASMGIREYAAKKRAEVAEELKNHPELLKQANDAIDDLLEKLS